MCKSKSTSPLYRKEYFKSKGDKHKLGIGFLYENSCTLIMIKFNFIYSTETNATKAIYRNFLQKLFKSHLGIVLRSVTFPVEATLFDGLCCPRAVILQTVIPVDALRQYITNFSLWGAGFLWYLLLGQQCSQERSLTSFWGKTAQNEEGHKNNCLLYILWTVTAVTHQSFYKIFFQICSKKSDLRLM